MEMLETAFSYQINPKEVMTSDNLLDQIGKGGYGDVRKVYTKKFGVSAAKIFKTTGTIEQHKTNISKIKEEADVLAFASHENVVRFQAVTHWASYVAIIMQYEARGSLHELLKDYNQVTELPFKLRYRMAYEFTKALVFLHSFGIDDRMVHGDLKSSNLLLNEDLRLRVADFGTAHIGTITCGGPSNCDRPTNTLVHTVAFSAPELLKNIFQRRATSMDVFSFGRVLYELITRRVPYQEQQCLHLSSLIIDGAEPDSSVVDSIQQNLTNTNDEDLRLFVFLRDLMQNCCSRNSSTRPSMTGVEKKMKVLKDSLSSISMQKSVALVLNQMQKPKPNSPVSSRIALDRFLH